MTAFEAGTIQWCRAQMRACCEAALRLTGNPRGADRGGLQTEDELMLIALKLRRLSAFSRQKWTVVRAAPPIYKPISVRQLVQLDMNGALALLLDWSEAFYYGRTDNYDYIPEAVLWLSTLVACGGTKCWVLPRLTATGTQLDDLVDRWLNGRPSVLSPEAARRACARYPRQLEFTVPRAA